MKTSLMIECSRLAGLSIALLLACGCSGKSAADSGSDAAPAGTLMTASVGTAKGSPFEIRDCSVTLFVTTDSSGNQVPHVSVQLLVKDVSDRALTISKARIYNADAFGKAPDRSMYTPGEEVTIAAKLDAGASMRSNRISFDKVAPDTGTVKCVPYAAVFADGSIWNSDDQ